MFNLLAISTTVYSGQTTAPPAGDVPFYGLTLVSNGPATFGLVRVESSSGGTTLIGPEHNELFGCSDLVAVADGVFFYFGDTSSGSTLVGLNLTDGTEVCSKPVDVHEVGYVGMGQTLDYDASTKTLVLSGIVNATSHGVFRSPASGCGPFKAAGAYGEAAFLPMLHSSTFDAAGQRLFLLLATTKSTTSVGVVQLGSGGGKPLSMRVIAEGATDPDDTLIGMHWDHATSSLYGITASQATGLELHSLQPDTTVSEVPTWKHQQVSGVPSDWNALLGNSATVSTFKDGAVTFIAGVQDAQGNIASQFFASVDVATAALRAHPKLAPIGLGNSELLALTTAGSV